MPFKTFDNFDEFYRFVTHLQKLKRSRPRHIQQQEDFVIDMIPFDLIHGLKLSKELNMIYRNFNIYHYHYCLPCIDCSYFLNDQLFRCIMHPCYFDFVSKKVTEKQPLTSSCTWYHEFTTLNHLKHREQSFEIWHLWFVENEKSYLYWLHQEVLQDIIKTFIFNC